VIYTHAGNRKESHTHPQKPGKEKTEEKEGTKAEGKRRKAQRHGRR
jgi:hypothetical protein